MKRLLRLTMLFLLLTMLSVSFFACDKSDDKKEEPSNKELSIVSMSYNIRTSNVFFSSNEIDKWSYRKEALTSHVLQYSPDTVGMQEVTKTQLRDLKEALTDYAYVGKARDANNAEEYNPIFYKKDKFELLDSGTFWLSKTPNVVSKYPDATCNRICTYCKLKDIETGKVFLHYNTHLDHPAENESVRVFSANLILEKTKDVSCPMLLTGDFNTTPDSDSYKLFAGTLQDARKVATITEQDATFHSYGDASLIIDYIFFSESIQVDEFHVLNEKVNDRYTSDHYALISKYVIK